MTEQEYFAKTIADKEDEYKALSPQGQYVAYKAIVDYGYEQGEIVQKPNSVKEDIEDFVTEWLEACKESKKENNYEPERIAERQGKVE